MHVVQTINIVLVFTISGLVLKTDDLKKAIKAPLGIIYGFVAILLITPCLGFALRELPLTPPEFAVGECGGEAHRRVGEQGRVAGPGSG